MRKIFFGSVSIIYSIIIMYTIISNKIGYFLSPNIQSYLIYSVLPLLVVGTALFFDSSNKEIKISDFILLLPLLMIILAGNGEFTSSFAKNRTIKEDLVEKEVVNENKEEDTLIDINDSNYIYYYKELNSKNINKYIGKDIKLTGVFIDDKKSKELLVGKYAMNCCAADAQFIGFKIDIENNEKLIDNEMYELEGIIEAHNSKLNIKVNKVKKSTSNKADKYLYSSQGGTIDLTMLPIIIVLLIIILRKKEETSGNN